MATAKQKKAKVAGKRQSQKKLMDKKRAASRTSASGGRSSK